MNKKKKLELLSNITFFGLILFLLLTWVEAYILKDNGMITFFAMLSILYLNAYLFIKNKLDVLK